MTITAKHQQLVLQQFARQVARDIPLTDFMQLEFRDYTGLEIRIDAPLAPNINDKNTGFGGSLVTLATLAGWSLLSLLCREQGRCCEVVIGESSIRYLAPATDQFYVWGAIQRQVRQQLQQALQRGEGYKAAVSAEVMVDQQVVALFSGTYFIKPLAPRAPCLNSANGLSLAGARRRFNRKQKAGYS